MCTFLQKSLKNKLKEKVSVTFGQLNFSLPDILIYFDPDLSHHYIAVPISFFQYTKPISTGSLIFVVF